MGDKGINRREFMVRTTVGMATLGLGAVPALAATQELSKTPEIVYRTLGRTGLRIPVVSFGVMNTDSPDLIRKAADLGIKLMDTAHRYMRGNSETVIGQVLEERKCRDKVYLATKMYFDREKERKVFLGEESGRADPATEKRFHDQLALSLKRLRTDYVDILYLHSCEGPLMPTFEPMMKVFSRAKEAGKARFIGITTHVNEPEVIRAAVDAGIWDVILTSYNFMQHHKEEVKKAIQYAVDKGVGVIAMKTQGGVALNREKPVQINHRAALKWVLSDRNVCTTVPGITAFEQMDLDFSVMQNLGLSDEEKRDLTMASLLKDPLYCQQCGSCKSSCLQRVEIPTLMRAYMYAEGYRNLIQAEATVQELAGEPGLNACGNCEACSAVCPFGINIRARVNALMAMNLSEKRLA